MSKAPLYARPTTRDGRGKRGPQQFTTSFTSIVDKDPPASNAHAVMEDVGEGEGREEGRYVGVNDTFLQQHIAPLQRWEDGTPNVDPKPCILTPNA